MITVWDATSKLEGIQFGEGIPCKTVEDTISAGARHCHFDTEVPSSWAFVRNDLTSTVLTSLKIVFPFVVIYTSISTFFSVGGHTLPIDQWGKYPQCCISRTHFNPLNLCRTLQYTLKPSINCFVKLQVVDFIVFRFPCYCN